MNPDTLKTMVDALFGALEKATPTLAPYLVMLNGFVDSHADFIAQWLTDHGISVGATITGFIDGLFAAIEAKYAGHTFFIAFLKMLNSLVDGAVPKINMPVEGFSGK